MKKGFSLSAVVLLCSLCVSMAFGAEPGKYNELCDPVDVVKKLSYENYKNLRLLRSAIYNYGAGQQEFEQLVNGYATASALYFTKRYKEAADAFTKNKQDIQRVAMRLIESYRQDTLVLHKNVVNDEIKKKIAADVNNKTYHKANEKTVIEASEILLMAEDFFVREKPAQAIEYYRLAKARCFKYYEITDQEKILQNYQKDLVDNENQIYVSKKKEK